MGHLVSETFAISHHNTYTYDKNDIEGNRVIGEFLRPHFIDLIAINTLARETMVAKVNDTLSEMTSIPGNLWPQIIAEWYTTKENIWNTDIGFVEEL